MDVSKSESIKAAFDIFLLCLSEGLWGLVNNAGVPVNPGYYDWWTREDFRSILEVNLLGPVEVTNVFLPLVKRARGRIVNVSSGIAMMPLSSGGYEMAKCGLEAFSDCLRLQMRSYSISVHIIQPGYFRTQMNNENTVAEKLEMVWNRMSQRQRVEYGRQCIDQMKERSGLAAKASDPRLYLVTDAIEHALFAWYPWKRYPIGGIVRFVVRPLNILPAFISDLVKDKLFPLPKPQHCR
ncbi:retinol dehydrogenase 7-like [Amphiura filiformis]|uniref:retinol dehydrogenase 7-like n=1 Tax=Amphiura filiformis TaxID=82378 RepID=UPI003B223FAA